MYLLISKKSIEFFFSPKYYVVEDVFKNSLFLVSVVKFLHNLYIKLIQQIVNVKAYDISKIFNNLFPNYDNIWSLPSFLIKCYVQECANLHKYFPQLLCLLSRIVSVKKNSSRKCKKGWTTKWVNLHVQSISIPSASEHPQYQCGSV